MEKISKQAREELVNALRTRYRGATKIEKGVILREFTSVSGFHRKHAIRLISKGTGAKERTVVPGERVYDQAVKEALTVIWEAADRICGKRLKALIPQLVAAMERHGHLKLATEVRSKLLAVSAATMDRMLKPVRLEGMGRRKRRLAKSVSKKIPIKTLHDWKAPEPGYTEIDFVVHGGGSMAGEYLHSLVVTDVCSGWVEAVPLLAREQSLVVEGLKRIGEQMPMPLRGIDSDNDGAFINDTVAGYCEKAGIVFTRSRAHHKNDQAWIEQKNGAVIRRIVGHERFAGLVAGQVLGSLYQAVRLYVNYFQPSFKLRKRSRVKGRVKKVYYPPATPCDRLLENIGISEEAKGRLRVQRERLDPVGLLHRIRQGQAALAALSSGVSEAGPGRESLEEFLASLPQLWRGGEVRATHRKTPSKPRDWRTRVDPFQSVWPEILLWLQAEPDCTAKSLFARLQEKAPGKFTKGMLRTLQRRIGEWRQTMARRLVFGGIEAVSDSSAIGAPPWGGDAPLASLDSASPPQGAIIHPQNA